MKNKKKFIVAIDQGTTSSRAILFDIKGRSLFKSQLEFKQYFPKNGWVEHDPEEIWEKTKKVLINVINKSKKLRGKILTIGITNQRETTILWDRISGKPVYNAIVWQDRRTLDFCRKFWSRAKEKLKSSKLNKMQTEKGPASIYFRAPCHSPGRCFRAGCRPCSAPSSA